MIYDVTDQVDLWLSIFALPPLVLKLYLLNWFYLAYKRAIPVQAWAGPDVSRRLRLQDFMTLST